MTGCAFDPDIPNARYQCSSPDHCPEGFSCVQVGGLFLEDGTSLKLCCKGGSCASGLNKEGKPLEVVRRTGLPAPILEFTPASPDAGIPKQQGQGREAGALASDAAEPITMTEVRDAPGGGLKTGPGAEDAASTLRPVDVNPAAGDFKGQDAWSPGGDVASAMDVPLDQKTVLGVPVLDGPVADRAISDAPALDMGGAIPFCGNSVVEMPSETCDPLSTCPTTCPWMGCMKRRLSGGGTCGAVCESDGVQTVCANGDGCCPATCTANNDTDCSSSCGNKTVETGELCDGNCPTACPPLGCMKRRLEGAGCNAACVADGTETRCQDNDGCCPGAANACNATNDKDCSASCGNGTKEASEKCDGDCQSKFNACISDQATIKTRTGAVADCSFECVTATRACSNGDTFCPMGCVYAQDTDCLKEPGDACSVGGDCRLGHCYNNVCCNVSCGGACEACNRSGKIGICAVPDYQSDSTNCGGCAMPCSTNHTAAVCTTATCTGTCQSGFDDCNSDKRTDGCETDTVGNPSNCGMCNRVCPYGVCQNSACASAKYGFFTVGASSANRFANTMYCSRIFIGAAGKVAALGVQTVTGAVNFRLGLYSNSSNAPLTLIAQTAELTSLANAATEGSVAPTSVALGDHWLCLVSAGTMRITLETATGPTVTGSRTYGAFPATAPVLTLASPDPAIPDVYVVTTP